MRQHRISEWLAKLKQRFISADVEDCWPCDGSLPTCSPAIALNPPLNVPEAAEVQYVFQLFWMFPKRGQPFKSPAWETDPPLTQGPSMTSPTPYRAFKGTQKAGTSVCFRQRPTAHPPPLVHQESTGTHALQEVLSGTPAKLLPPQPCIGHHSPTSPSAAGFKKVPSPDPASRSPP